MLNRFSSPAFVLLLLLSLAPHALSEGPRPGAWHRTSSPGDVSSGSLIVAPRPQDHPIIPRLDAAPKLTDFLSQPLGSPAARQMLKISKFIDLSPEDGQPITESTTAFLGYTHESLFVAFLCNDSHPGLLRAHLLQRDALSDDDYVEVMLDTFRDERRAFLFKANALGVQADALYTEQTGSDYSFDTVWDTWGKRTPHGYVVLMRIPFASLRFKDVPEGDLRTWGLLLQRNITRKNESAWWPQVRHNIAGRLTQEIPVEGFANVESGKNRQLEPYGLLHRVRQLNTINPVNPYFNDKLLQGYTGMDAKFVLHNSLVLDLTVNPDFSQIGIQNPAPPNQRFQYYYPELRPFFIENSSYFATPLNLYYTPNIVMPKYGERLTGKVGPWAVGLLNIDDRNPGQQVPQGTQDSGTHANFYVGRINRDIGPQSNIGTIYAERTYLGSSNRDIGVDYRVRLHQRWTLVGQAVNSESQHRNGSRQSGQGYVQSVSYSDLHKSFFLNYNDIAAGYRTQTGFFTRPDVREPNGAVGYVFRPKTGPILSHGPHVYAERIWDHTGLPLDFYIDPSYGINFKHRTSLSAFFQTGEDRLRPVDYSVLSNNVEYHSHVAGVNVYTSPMPQIALGSTYYAGKVINYYPETGHGPYPVDVQSSHTNVEVKPLQQVDLLNTYEFDRFSDPASGDVAYDSHQVVTRWNLQMDKAWSLTFIGEYLATLPNDHLTDLANNKDVFGDVLLTYLPHPGTAFYIGYTTDYENLNAQLCTRGADGACNTQLPILPRTGSSFLNDQQVIYMKLNYLLRF